MAWKFLTSASESARSAWDKLSSAVSSGPNIAAGDKYDELQEGLKSYATDFPVNKDIKDQLANFPSVMKNDINSLLSQFEAKKIDKDEFNDEMKFKCDYYRAKLNDIQDEHLTTLESDDKKQAAEQWHQQQNDALNQYFQVLEDDFNQYLAKLGSKKATTPTEAHLAENEPKEKVAILNGDKTVDPRKKDAGVDLTDYTVPVHYDKKNAKFTFYNVEATKPEDARRAVDALAEKGFTSIKITGEFKDNIKQEMWMRAQCKNPPLKVDGYIPTEGDRKTRDEFRLEKGMPSIEDLNKKAGVKAKKAAEDSKEATTEARASEAADTSLRRK